MNEKETKIKMKQCVVCGNEFNVYTRPFIARFTCSEECRGVNRARRQEAYRESQKKRKEVQKKRRQNALIIYVIVSLITGIIGAFVGGYLYNAMGMVGDPGMVMLIGFGIGLAIPLVCILESY